MTDFRDLERLEGRLRRLEARLTKLMIHMGMDPAEKISEPNKPSDDGKPLIMSPNKSRKVSAFRKKYD